MMERFKGGTKEQGVEIVNAGIDQGENEDGREVGCEGGADTAGALRVGVGVIVFGLELE